MIIQISKYDYDRRYKNEGIKKQELRKIKVYCQKVSFAADTAEVVVIASFIMMDGITAIITENRQIQIAIMSATNKAIHITKEYYAAIVSTVAAFPPETGGILGSNDGDSVTSFVSDKGKDSTVELYIPNVAILNETIVAWRQKGTKFVGMIHSHLLGRNKPSTSDVDYAKRIMNNMNLEHMYMLLVNTDTLNHNISVFEITRTAEPVITKLEYVVDQKSA